MYTPSPIPYQSSTASAYQALIGARRQLGPGVPGSVEEGKGAAGAAATGEGTRNGVGTASATGAAASAPGRSEPRSREAGPEREEGENGQLSEEEQAQVEKLKARDREVRAHEQAHLAAAGGIAMGGASFSYQRGPDGVQYAIGGEVSIDTSAVAGDPQATLQKAQQVQRAALAPADPSSQDRKVAAQAARMAAEARAEVAKQEGGDAGNAKSDEAGTDAAAESGTRRARASAAYGAIAAAAARPDTPALNLVA